MKKILVIDDLPENVFILQDRLMQEGKLSRMDAIKAVARERKISKSQAYREYKP